MKKLSFIFAMVFAASFAMAQHTEVLTQTGDDNSATITQGFGVPAGPALPGNEAIVTQTGDDNIADVDQVNNGYAGSEHKAEVLSVGNSNYAKIDQQLEDRGNAIIDQLGNGNDARITQVGNFGAAEPINPPYDAYALQHGNDNDILMNIFGTNSTARAIQYGNENLITQNLGQAVGEKVENSRALASQYGNSNTISQTFEGEGFETPTSPTVVWDEERAFQDGFSNYSEQLIKDDLLPSSNNFMTVSQVGDDNNSWQTQAGQNNYMIHNQNGNLNDATATQTGSFNFLSVTQNGNGNNATDTQTGFSNEAYVQQN